MEGREVRTTRVGWRRVMIRDGIPVLTEGTTRRILTGGTRAMTWLGRTRCKNRSRRSSSGTVLQVSRQVMGEVEGRDGCKMTRMGLKSFRCFFILLQFWSSRYLGRTRLGYRLAELFRCNLSLHLGNLIYAISYLPLIAFDAVFGHSVPFHAMQKQEPSALDRLLTHSSQRAIKAPSGHPLAPAH